MLPTSGADELRSGLARVARLADSARVQKLDRLEHVWNGTQYDARPNFWDKSVPVQERAPCVVHPVARIAGQRLASLVFGESQFPKCTPLVGATATDPLGLSDSEAKVLADLLSALIEETSLKLRSREMTQDGLKVGTAVPVVSIKAGMPRVDLLPAKWCTPTFDKADGERVVALVYQYRYDDPENPGKSLWYRREITEKTDREWRGVPCDREGYQPNWELEPASAEFAIEFCPVTWPRNLPDSSCTDELDGIAIAEGLFEEIEALDLAHSMRHRNALYNGDPLTVVTGAGPESVEATPGRDADPSKLPRNPNGSGNIGGWIKGLTGGGGKAIAKSPGSILFLNQEGASASLLESSGAGNKILADDAEAIRKLVFETMAVIVTDPATFGTGDLSARALSMLFKPMLDLANNLRECWGKALRRVLGQLLRLCAGAIAERDGLYVRGIEAARPILRRFFVQLRPAEGDIAPRVRWIDPPIELTWGPYFDPSQQELQATSQWLTTAVTGGIMSRRSAVTKLLSVANLSNSVDAELTEIAKERADGQAAVGGMLGAINRPQTGDTSPQVTPDANE